MDIGSILAALDNFKRRAGLLATDPANAIAGRSGPEFGASPPPQFQGGGLLSAIPQMRDADVDGALKLTPGLLGIVSPIKAVQSGVAPAMPIAPEFRAAVQNTPGASLTDNGLLMNVMRNQLPEQGQMESVRGGVFYLPQGSASAKHYATGTTKPGGNYYGGPERISGQTLVSNPLFVKGATGGKAPETAYDSLLGKGSYQTMRRDARHWSGGPQNIREEAVTAFLDKYAPEMSDQAWNILENSKRGNQLAYALQEAAVASAARNAGHDAVLGYSVARSTKQPFLSELFDVRESHYPDAFGWSRVWPQFEPK